MDQFKYVHENANIQSKRRFPDSVHNSDINDTIQLSCKKSEVVRSFSHRKIGYVTNIVLKSESDEIALSMFNVIVIDLLCIVNTK